MTADFYVNWGLVVRIEEAAPDATCPRCDGGLYTRVYFAQSPHGLCPACAQAILTEATHALYLII